MKHQLSHYKAAFHNQKSSAKRRGIGWELTFEQWVKWWGDDIDRRGGGHDSLQMQRIANSGPYSLDNIRKGFPMDNSRTWARVHANRRAQKAKDAHQQFLDALIAAQSKENREYDDRVEDEIKGNGVAKRVSFLADKHR